MFVNVSVVPCWVRTGISEKKQFTLSCGTQDPVILEPVQQKVCFTFCSGIKVPLVIVCGKAISTSRPVRRGAVSDGAEQGLIS